MVKLFDAKRSPGAVKLGVFGKEFSFRYAEPPTISIEDLNPWAQSGYTGYQPGVYDGDKFPGGFGATQLFQLDYWALRARSAQLYTENLYARGLIRRLVTNEIGTGLTPEASPSASLLGADEDKTQEWADELEDRYEIWGSQPEVCDHYGESTIGALEQAARLEALVCGDVLIVMRQSPITKAPQIQLVNGASVRTPFFSRTKMPKTHSINHGVETNRKGRIVAYHVRQLDGTFERILAYGSKTGRRNAWLVFGTDKRYDEVRGQPLLSIVLQSLKEIDRYRDAVQRKAVVNSILAMFIKNGAGKVSSKPWSAGSRRKDTATVTDGDGTQRDFNLSTNYPGFVMEVLNKDEEPVAFGSQGTDLDFEKFEGAILRAVAWAQEMPPEILVLSFQSNYSASAAAINEFKIYLNMMWAKWGPKFNTPIYIDFTLSEVLARRMKAPGLLEAWRDPRQWTTFGAWTLVQWYGSIKPSTDMTKEVKGSEIAVANCWTNNAKVSRNISGTSFRRNSKKVTRENKLKAEAARPLKELEKEFGPVEDTKPLPGAGAVSEDDVMAILDDYMDERGVGDG